ncbi:MAG: hypothetical protein ACUVWN_14710 [bacterium]
MYRYYFNMGNWNILVKSINPSPKELIANYEINSNPDLVLEIVLLEDLYIHLPKIFEEFNIEGGAVRLIKYNQFNIEHLRAGFKDEWRYNDCGSLESLLFRAFYSLSHRENYKDILVHASAIAKDGMGYMFMGPSGSGKSTITEMLAKECISLHDEIIILHDNNHNFNIQGSPFHTSLVFNNELNPPLRAVFFLKHGKNLSIQKVDPSNAFVLFLSQIVPPISFNKNFLQLNKEVLDKVSNLCARLVDSIQFHILEFSLSDDVWQNIENFINS